jgi:HSP20 family molecular chaperone IbpA
MRELKYITGGCLMGSRFISIGDFEKMIDEIVNEVEGVFSQPSKSSTKNWGFNFPNFPPADLKVDKDKNLYFDFALAGYKRDEIDISFQGDWMVLEIEPHKEEEQKDMAYLNRGIRKSSSTSKYYVPHDKYNTDNVKGSFNDGMLKIYIPSKEPEKARRVLIE